MQAEADVLPLADLALASHAMQLVDDVAGVMAEYVLTGQGVQADEPSLSL